MLGRCLQALGSLWAVVTATFVLLHLLPGNPFLARQVPPIIRARLLAHYGLDLPLWRQYLRYWAELSRGDLGVSLVVPGRSVRQVIATALPVSAVVGVEALCWSVLLGAVLGLLAAWRPGRPWDWLALAVSVLGLSIPNFVLAGVLDYLLAVRWRLLPVAGWGGVAHTLLPAAALGGLALALVSRLVRAQAVEILQLDYVRAARARGLSWAQVLGRHVLRNALLPVLTSLGPLAASLVVGSLAVESIFALPGLGTVFVQSVLARDYPVVLGVTITYAALLLAFNLLIDLLYGALDPRIRLGRGEV